MSFCRRCGKFLDPGNLYCPFCGEKAEKSSTDADLGTVGEEDFRAFLGSNAEKYLRKFKSFSSVGTVSFAFTWNWSAFFLGFIWFLYRKMYLWALVAFFLGFTPVSFPLLMIGWGLAGNYIYFRQARKKILDFRSSPSLSSPTLSLADLGGVNRWVWIFGILFVLMFALIGFLGIAFISPFLERSGFYHPKIVQI